MADLNVGQLGLLLAVTLASAVEFVEAFTIVLAMGITRDWRSTLAGTALALVALAAVTLFAGYALIEWFPEALLQLVIGTLLLIFGLQWLRKAILRAAGLKAQHDEDAIFHEEAAAARGARRESVMGLDWFAFVVSFKGVFLEGLEVVFIVLTFGLSAGNVPLAVAGAAVAGTTVLVVGALLHRPLSRVPENTIKYGVGILLSTFGTFWAVEGLGVFAPDGQSLEWPGAEAALIVVLVTWIAVSQVLITTLRRRQCPRRPEGRSRAVDRGVRSLLVRLHHRRRLADRRRRDLGARRRCRGAGRRRVARDHRAGGRDRDRPGVRDPLGSRRALIEATASDPAACRAVCRSCMS